MSTQPGNQADHEAAIRTARALEIPIRIEKLERSVTKLEEVVKTLTQSHLFALERALEHLKG